MSAGPFNAAIVTARAGSKSIADKNVHPVGGRPLVAYPIQAALDAARVGRVFVSTDGESIAAVARELGCEVILRPDELGGDHVNHGDVIRHAVEWVDARHPGLENVVLLPHLGSANAETRIAMGMKALANVEAFARGAPLPDRIA